MGFMDKVKAAAQDAAAQAKTATSSAQIKMEQVQLKKKMDESARRLGYLIYRERTQGTASGAEGDSLVSEIAGYEAAIAAQAETSEPAGTAGVPAPEPPTAAEQPMAPPSVEQRGGAVETEQPVTPPPGGPASQP